MGTELLSQKDVLKRTSLSRSTLLRLIAAGRFPPPVRITEHRIAYPAADVEAWLQEKIAA